MESTNALTALINKTTDKILDEWTALAKIDGADVDDYIGDRLDEMAETDPATSIAIGQRFLQRVLAA